MLLGKLGLGSTLRPGSIAFACLQVDSNCFQNHHLYFSLHIGYAYLSDTTLVSCPIIKLN